MIKILKSRRFCRLRQKESSAMQNLQEVRGGPQGICESRGATSVCHEQLLKCVYTEHVQLCVFTKIHMVVSYIGGTPI